MQLHKTTNTHGKLQNQHPFLTNSMLSTKLVCAISVVVGLLLLPVKMVPQVVPAPSPLLILPQNSADLVVANAPAAGAGKRGHFIFFVGPLKVRLHVCYMLTCGGVETVALFLVARAAVPLHSWGCASLRVSHYIDWFNLPSRSIVHTTSSGYSGTRRI